VKAMALRDRLNTMSELSSAVARAKASTEFDNVMLKNL
jgi:hypothetical protein